MAQETETRLANVSPVLPATADPAAAATEDTSAIAAITTAPAATMPNPQPGQNTIPPQQPQPQPLPATFPPLENSLSPMVLGAKTPSPPDGPNASGDSTVDGAGAGETEDVWDEERLCEGLRKLDELHSKINSLRSTIPLMLAPLTSPLLDSFTSPNDLFNAFSYRAVTASEDVLNFTTQWQENKYLIERANLSRVKTREGIRRWGLKDGMPPGVYTVREEEKEDKKVWEERNKRVEREEEKGRRKRRRMNGPEGDPMIVDGADNEDVFEDESKSKEEEEERKRVEAERGEEIKPPSQVVEEFLQRIAAQDENDVMVKNWSGVGIEYIPITPSATTQQNTSQATATTNSTTQASFSSSSSSSAIAQIKVTLPRPTHFVFTIEACPQEQQASHELQRYRYIVSSLLCILPAHLLPQNKHHRSHHPPPPHHGQSSNLTNSILRAIAARPKPQQANLRILLEMICSYMRVYSDKCTACGRLLEVGGKEKRAELPIVRKREKVFRSSGWEGGDAATAAAAGGKIEGKVKEEKITAEGNDENAGAAVEEAKTWEWEWQVWHGGCLDAGKKVGEGVGGGAVGETPGVSSTAAAAIASTATTTATAATAATATTAATAATAAGPVISSGNGVGTANTGVGAGSSVLGGGNKVVRPVGGVEPKKGVVVGTRGGK